MLDVIGESNAAALLGLLGGSLLGLAARRGRFCTLGAVEDFLYSSDDRRLRMWGLAIGIAVIGTHLGAYFDRFDFSETTYLTQSWNPVAVPLGGLVFGYGMALSGNCGFGALARLGGGDLRSFVIILVLGLSAYIVMSGPLAYIRIWLFPVDMEPQTPQSLSLWLEQKTGLSALATALIIGLTLIGLSLASKNMRASPKYIFWGFVVGLVIVSGWLGTYWISANGFDAKPVESHAFAAPIGDTMLFAMTASGNAISFSVGSVVGVLSGAFIGSYSKGHFRWEACEDPRELRRQISGAVIMGAGAILAVGCSIGQGMSAFALLAFSAPVALISIFTGAAIGLKILIEGRLGV